MIAHTEMSNKSKLNKYVFFFNLLDIRKIFMSYDMNRDGHISLEDLDRVMKLQGKTLSAKQLKEMIEPVDYNGNANLSPVQD